MEVSRFNVVDDPDYTVDLQEVEGKLFVHITVHEFNKNVYKRIIESSFDIEEALQQYGYTEVYAVTKSKSFAEKMGLHFIDDIYNEDDTYGVYVWEL